MYTHIYTCLHVHPTHGSDSGAGKTQLLLTLLLSAQLPSPKGLHRPSLYISTEAPLATARLSQLLHHHPQLAHLPAGQRPSLDAVLSITVPDLESQDHILRYQVPVSIRRHSIGLVIIDSVAANYRAEFEGRRDHLANLAVRSADLIRLGALLRHLARTENVAVVVANQVADRFGQDSFSSSPPSHRKMHSPDYPLDRMMLDHQQCWFTGWGDELSPDHQHHHHPSPNVSSYLRHVENPSLMNLKTPSLGHTWTLQIAARIALVKEVAHGHADFRTVPVYDDNPVTRDRSHHDTHDRNHDGGIDKGGGGGGGGATDSENDLGGAVGDQNRKKSTMHWKRRLKVVFAPWVSPTTVTANNGLGIEFVISRTGIHSVSAPLISS